MTLRKNGNNKQENTLYLQLLKDTRRLNKREYIPVVVFQHPESMNIENYKKSQAKQKIAAIFSPLPK